MDDQALRIQTERYKTTELRFQCTVCPQLPSFSGYRPALKSVLTYELQLNMAT